MLPQPSASAAGRGRPAQPLAQDVPILVLHPDGLPLVLADKRFQAMGAARRITISLPEETARAAGEAAARRGCSRSELIREALQWHLRVQNLPVKEPTPEERAALAAGRAQHARGEYATLDEIRRELAADLLAQRSKKPAKASA